jgi:hypothetical protein
MRSDMLNSSPTRGTVGVRARSVFVLQQIFEPAHISPELLFGIGWPQFRRRLKLGGIGMKLAQASRR